MKTVTRYIVDAMDEDETGELVSYYDFEKAQEELGKQDAEIIFLKARLNDALKRLDTAAVLLKETHPAEAGSMEEFIERCTII